MAITGSSLDAIRSAAMQPDGEHSISSGTAAVVLPPASFDALKQIDAGVLSVGYAEAGPPNGRAVVLLHGWPYDIHTYVDVAPLLAAKGYRVIVPSLRGYGSTRFLSPGAARNGQQAAIAVDVIALYGCAQDRQGDCGGLRLGRANGEHRCGPVAGALQSPRVGERLPDWQPGREPEAASAAV